MIAVESVSFNTDRCCRLASLKHSVCVLVVSVVDYTFVQRACVCEHVQCVKWYRGGEGLAELFEQVITAEHV